MFHAAWSLADLLRLAVICESNVVTAAAFLRAFHVQCDVLIPKRLSFFPRVYLCNTADNMSWRRIVSKEHPLHNFAEEDIKTIHSF